MKALDMRMNWREAAKIIAAALQDGTATGKQAAREELLKMALAADLAVDATNALKDLVRLKGIKRRIDTRVATPPERAEYKRSKEQAWARAEKVAGRIA